MEVGEELVDGAGRLHPLVEIIGVREQESLQPVGISRLYAFQEGIGKLSGCRRLIKRLGAAHTALLQSGKDLVHIESFWQHDQSLKLGIGADLHLGHQRPIVQVGGQRVGAGVHFQLRVGEVGVDLEQPFIVDEPRILQYGGHRLDVRCPDSFAAGDVAVFVLHVHLGIMEGLGGKRDLYGAHWLVQRQHVRGRHPHKSRQDDAQTDDEGGVHQPSQAADAAVPAGTDGTVAPLLLPGVRLRFPGLAGSLFLFGLGFLFLRRGGLRRFLRLRLFCRQHRRGLRFRREIRREILAAHFHALLPR